MIILDNSVLSAFTRLGVLDKLKSLVSVVYITKTIAEEYTGYWQKTIPSWIIIKEMTHEHQLNAFPTALSVADISVIELALNLHAPLASDDRILRDFAKEHGIKVTGSLGIIKQMYKTKLIILKEEYISILDSLAKDVYVSQELLKWALDEE